ncbi:MAG: hypothetical protein B7Z37_26180 [Verrucomicrobia bacterium 12-59-8]|nr:MAG: hypothetical protein B7Z37_26180 [Verrucomicrobia bacterium 12-59-8]
MRAFFSKYWIFSLVVTILILWLGWWIGVSILVETKDRGTIGDLFGGINALFSGLALAGVVTAVILQSKELELQRGEMRLQRNQLELQRKELELSREEYKRMASANEEAAKALTNQLRLQIQAAKLHGLSTLATIANDRGLSQNAFGHSSPQVREAAALRLERELRAAITALKEDVGEA